MQHPETVSVLVVDDDDVAFEGIVRSLRRGGLSNPVLNARDGVEALEILRGTHSSRHIAPPYLVLLDLNMPRMNGLEFLRALRADTLLSDTVVFVLSTSNHASDKACAYREHIAGYMVKRDLGTDYHAAIELLERYWRAVSLPVK